MATKCLNVVVKFGAPWPGRGSALSRSLVWTMARVAAAVAGEVPVMRQIQQVRTNYGAGCVEVDALVLAHQDVAQVQADILAAVDAIPAGRVGDAAGLLMGVKS